MVKRLFKIKPLFILVFTLVTSPAMAEDNQSGQKSPAGTGTQAVMESIPTLTTTAVSYIAPAPDLSLASAELEVALNETRQIVLEDLKRNAEALFHISLQAETLAQESSDENQLPAHVISHMKIRIVEASASSDHNIQLQQN